MSKPHLNPPCYSKEVTVVDNGPVITFSCSYCHRTWERPAGISATFENGTLVAATEEGLVPVSEERIKEMRENRDWSVEYLSQFV